MRTKFKSILRQFDEVTIKRMRALSSPAIRFSFGVIFIWFGILKILRLSAAEELLLKTVQWLPVGLPETWLVIISIWEVTIGVLFLFRQTTRIAIALLFLQMVGTFMPLVFLPEITFQSRNILLPTMEGQYIIKNLMIISAALVLGGRKRELS